jgi:uncharacterized protein with gpF-like domain
MIQRDRLTGILDYLQDRYNYYAGQIYKTQKQIGELSISNQYYRQQFALSWLADSGIKFSAINPNLIELSVSGTIESWKKYAQSLADKYNLSASEIAPVYGTLADYMYNYRVSDLQKIQSQITLGLIQGSSSAVIGKSIGGIMDNFRYQYDRIARTEAARIMNEGTQIASIDAMNKGLDIMRMWKSAHDKDVRPRHAKMDGLLAKPDEPFKIPGGGTVMRPGAWEDAGDNIHERCTTVDVPMDETTGQPDLPRFRRGRNPVTGKNEVYEIKYFDQWAKEHGLKTNIYGQRYAA